MHGDVLDTEQRHRAEMLTRPAGLMNLKIPLNRFGADALPRPEMPGNIPRNHHSHRNVKYAIELRMNTTKRSIDDVQMDTNNLYREETITDLRTGTIKVLYPIKTDGSPNSIRPPMFVCQTELMSNAGMIPVSAPIEAQNLGEAIEKFPAAVKQAVDDMIKRVQDYQREQASRIVTPGELGNPHLGGAPGGGKGGLII